MHTLLGGVYAIIEVSGRIFSQVVLRFAMAVKAGGKRNRSTEHALDAAKKVSKRTELSIEEKFGLLDWYHSNGRNQVSTVNHFKEKKSNA